MWMVSEGMQLLQIKCTDLVYIINSEIFYMPLHNSLQYMYLVMQLIKFAIQIIFSEKIDNFQDTCNFCLYAYLSSV